MNNIEGFTILNIRDYLQNDNEFVEADLKQLISDFSCPLNPDVEKFLTKNAIPDRDAFHSFLLGIHTV